MALFPQETVVSVDRDPATDRPLLPLKSSFRGVRVLALGRVEFRDMRWHSDKYIFPNGFKSEKKWKSFGELIYLIKILSWNIL